MQSRRQFVLKGAKLVAVGAAAASAGPSVFVRGAGVISALTLTIQELVYSLTFISSVGRMTVSVGVPVALIRGDVYYWGSLMAACLITSVPLAILYNFFLDRFIAGFTIGAIK